MIFPLGKDDHGREAFAYLAILLMLSSMAYAAYAGFIESDRRMMEKESLLIGNLRTDLANLRDSISSDVSVNVEESFSYLERESILNLSEESIDGRLQRNLEISLPNTTKNIMINMNESGRGSMAFMEGISVEVIPIYSGIEGVLPSSDPIHDNISGLIEIGDRCEILSVSIIIDIDFRLETMDGGISKEEDLHLEYAKDSLSDFLRSRQDRLNDAVRSGEFDRIFSYLITSLVQQKSILGYGRKITPGNAGYSGPLITENEIETIADMSLSLLTQAHLRCSDDDFMTDISSNISLFPGAGGSTIPLNESLIGIVEPYDPAGLIMLAAGFGSEENPPSLDMIIRPLILSIADRLITKFQIYTGAMDANLVQVGGLIELYRMAVEVVDEGLEELGIDIVQDAKLTAWDMFTGMLESGGFNTSAGIKLLNRAMEDQSYLGERILHYPLIDVGTVDSTFDVYLTENTASMIYYIDGDGNRHSAEEYSHPGDVYFAHKCEVFRLNTTFRFREIEPGFQPVLLDFNRDFGIGLLSLLGTGGNAVDFSSDGLAKQGDIELRNALEKTIDQLSTGENGALWEEIYHGWNGSDPPSIVDRVHPVNEYLSLNADALWDFMSSLVHNLQNCLFSGVYADHLSDYSESWGQLIAEWLNDTYDIWTDRDLQIPSARDDIIRDFVMGCTVEVTGWEKLGPGFIVEDEAVFPPGGSQNIEWLIGERDVLVNKGLVDDIGTSEADDLNHLIEMKVLDSYDEIRAREVSLETEDYGVITGALIGSGTRGSDSIFNGIWEMPVMEAVQYLFDIVNNTYAAISRDMMRPYGMAGNTHFIAPPPPTDSLTAVPWHGGDIHDQRTFNANSSITRFGRRIITRSFTNGEYNTDPNAVNSSYRSFMSISFRGKYLINYNAYGGDFSPLEESMATMDVIAIADIEIDTSWPMEGVEYTPIRTLLDDVMDNGKRAAILILENLSAVVEEYLDGTMGSVSELPPLLIELVNGGDIDLTEVSRVLTNISMELSGKIREGVKGIVKQLIETGISMTLAQILRLFDIQHVDGSLSYGGVTVNLLSEVDALLGEDGRLLWLVFSIPTLGIEGSMDINRRDNSSFRFNGTIRIDIGGLHMRIEIDPFMDERPHILSIDGRYEKGAEILRFSVKFPDVDVYRSSEISLGSSLGISPMVFIPPIGMSAVFDGGFRIRYMAPSELKPHLNELKIIGGDIGGIEIFNPLGFSIGGYTLEIRTRDNWPISTIYIDGGNVIHEWIEISHSGYSLEGGPGGFMIMLRDPSGLISDDVKVTDPIDGYYSRESDGWGVWRMDDGSPGKANSGTGQFSFTSLLLGIVVSSLMEAWNEANNLYGLSFQTLVHFIERAIDLFMERALSAVAELVVDVRMFIDIKIAAGAGVSAGFGIELSFIAEGDAVARFLTWIYENVKVFFVSLMNPGGAGDYNGFPLDILSDCHIQAAFFFEVETPSALSKLAPEGADIPDSLNLGVSGRMNLALPLVLLGIDAGGWEIGAGVYVVDAPPSLISMFYDIPATSGQIDLWLLRAAVWCE